MLGAISDIGYRDRHSNRDVARTTVSGSKTEGRGLVVSVLLVIHPQAWLSDILSRIADHKINWIDELLPLNYHSK